MKRSGNASPRRSGSPLGAAVRRQLLVWGGCLVLFVVLCIAVRLYGCVRLAAATSNMQEVEKSVLESERANTRLIGVIDGRARPDRLTFARERMSMMPVSPNRAISWQPNAMMASSAATPSRGSGQLP